MDSFHSLVIRKSDSSVKDLFVRGVLAGLFVAFGALCSQIAVVWSGQSIGAACVFPIGLILVIFLRAELFTGNNLMTWLAFSGVIPFSSVFRNWVVVYIANFLGSMLFIQSVVGLFGLWDLFGGCLGNRMVDMALYKTHLPAEQMFLSGIACNIFVCLAVILSFWARTIIGKLIAIYIPIFLFVYFGFEHSIANMYFLGVARIVEPGIISLDGLFTNLFFVTLGNIVGGAIIVSGFLYALSFDVEKWRE